MQVLWADLTLILFFVVLVTQILIVKNRKADVKILDKRLLFNPFHSQFFGDKYLTKKGIFWRNISWASIVLYLLVNLL